MVLIFDSRFVEFSRQYFLFTFFALISIQKSGQNGHIRILCYFYMFIHCFTILD
jgi:hypothetical protein